MIFLGQLRFFALHLNKFAFAFKHENLPPQILIENK